MQPAHGGSVISRFSLLVLPVFLGLSQASADYYESKSTRGASIIRHGFGEECIVPKHFNGATYKKKDVEKETELCGFDLYAESSGGGRVAVGVCPKVESTNPAVELFFFAAESGKAAFEQRECVKRDDDREGKKLAKFKQSITCSYTPSILGYYHLSRILGNIGNVPASVVRTMDKEQHLEFVKEAGAIISKLYPKEDPVIEQAWRKTWPALHADPEGKTNGGRSALVFSRDFKFVYGALTQNPKKEFKYSELAGKSYETRYQDFKAKRQYKNLLNGLPLAEVYAQGSEQSRLERSAQLVTQMQDISDMIIMDYLMSQADRIGNAHFTYEYYYLEGGKIANVEAELVKVAGQDDQPDPKQAAELKSKGAVLVKKMMIRDNDCGVVKSNEARKHQLLKDIRHVSPETYRKLLWLQGLVKNSESTVKAFFQDEALFTEKDWSGFKTYLNEILEHLKTQCLKGSLHLDLNLEDVVKGRAPLNSQSFCLNL